MPNFLKLYHPSTAILSVAVCVYYIFDMRHLCFNFDMRPVEYVNRPFSHCFCACVYGSCGVLFLDNRRDFTQMGQTHFESLILSV